MNTLGATIVRNAGGRVIDALEPNFAPKPPVIGHPGSLVGIPHIGIAGRSEGLTDHRRPQLVVI
jgi:hypothetical protein